MSFVFVKRTYLTPGIYQWIKPSIVPNSGPQGSTYLQTIVTVIGAGSGGQSGNVNVNQTVGQQGGNGGGGGGFGQAIYLPSALAAIEDVVVAAGTAGGNANSIIANLTNAVAGQNGLTPTQSSIFGAHISCPGGNRSDNPFGGTPTVIGGTSVINLRGGNGALCVNGIDVQPGVGPGITNGGSPTFTNQNNNGGAPGGTASVVVLHPTSGQGGAVGNAPGGRGLINSSGNAQSGSFPGTGGGAAISTTGNAPFTAGSGAPAALNSGSGGGGGGAASVYAIGGATNITSGAGGSGANGAVQTVDVFLLPPPTNVIYIQWDIVAWFHMMNMARPISLTGRYKS